MLLSILRELPDFRRGQGRMYDLPHLVLFSILAIASNAVSYRQIEAIITTHFETLKKHFGITWKHAPDYSTIRRCMQCVDEAALERSLRTHAEKLATVRGRRHVSLDGKTVRGSFDHFQDQKAIQVFSALLAENELILAHETIEGNKTNEIPVAQKLIEELGLSGCTFTADAMHCQKKRCKYCAKQGTTASYR